MHRTRLKDGALDTTDRTLLNHLQAGLRPERCLFRGLAEAAGLDEGEVISRIERLRGIGAVTRFGPFIDAAALGGAYCLCAMAVPADRFDEVTAKVNAHDAVAHNYERRHRFNMWFVLACESATAIGAEADRIERETGLTVHRFPKLREFFIGFQVAL